jgi:hypothetical protein
LGYGGRLYAPSLFHVNRDGRIRFGDSYYEECWRRGVADNPQGPSSDSELVLRSGAWISNTRAYRSAIRYYGTLDNRFYGIGFCLVFVPQL